MTRIFRTGSSRTRVIASLALLVALGGSSLLASVEASQATAPETRSLEPFRLGPLASAEPTKSFRDTIIHGRRHAQRASAAGAATGTYYDQDGHSVDVAISSSYVQEPADAQAFVDFLGTLLHKHELSRLSAYIATPDEVEIECGAGSLACYDVLYEELIVPGENTPGEAPKEFVTAHELGHHIANNRNNGPWSASDWGPKYWATYVGVCPGVRAGAFNNGDYYDDASEGFAESYAFYHYPSAVSWDYNPDLAPDGNAYDAIYDDVTNPWGAIGRGTVYGGLSRNFQVKIRRYVTPLDGRIRVALFSPQNADFDLYLLAGGSDRVLAKSELAGRRDVITYDICGRAAVRVAVAWYSGAGTYRLTRTKPVYGGGGGGSYRLPDPQQQRR